MSNLRVEQVIVTAWKVSKYGVFSGPYFPAFSPNTGKYGPEKTPYLETSVRDKREDSCKTYK